MPMLNDTIVAISTPIGEGGIGIVRLSGPDALAILRRVLRRGKKGNAVPAIEPYRLHYGRVVDPATGETLDEVLASYMRAPHSYTREDVVEINCHGGIVPLRRILLLALRQGARLAEPGEFTLRAFLNGRLDLAQAEAVLDIIRAQTDASLRMALSQLEGRLSDRVCAVRQDLVAALAFLEASIDFAEDDVPYEDITPTLARAEAALEQLLAQSSEGIIYRQGVRVAIVGRPNVGKSSLLNALLRTSRAIVAPIPGTTRDTLEETLNLRGIPLCLVDTAGIAASEDLVTQLGIERSRQALQQADLVLFVVDRSEALTSADEAIAALLSGKTVILVLNKADLPAVAVTDGLLPRASRVTVSALTGEGIDTLEQAMEEAIFAGQVRTSDTPLVSNPRHQAILHRALEHVRAAQETHARGMPEDFVSIDLAAAVMALGDITGESATEDLLDTIFERFCVGK